MKINLSNYKELESFAKFGSDLDAHTKEIIDNGKRVVELLKQNEGEPYSFVDETILLLGVKYNLYHNIDVNKMFELKSYLLDKTKRSYKAIIKEVEKKKELDEELIHNLIDAFNSITKDFIEREI